MIISHKYRYLFVELPHTASTAISQELCQNYAGESILWKHAYYHEFLNIASADERGYFVFSGIRNPLDEAVSIYLKYKTDHRNNYTKPQKRQRVGGHVRTKDLRTFRYIKDTNAEFAAYFLKFYRLPYDNWSSLAHHQFDQLIRFENLQRDFSQTLQALDIESVRPLPITNPTLRKKSFLTYYAPDTHTRASFVFGPFMQKWGYQLPNEWNQTSLSPLSNILFNLLAFYRNTRRRYLGTSIRKRRKRAHAIKTNQPK